MSPDQTIVHKNITVSGRVQGVGFRYSCRKTANEFGITGFVKNLHNGNVYIEAEGNHDSMVRFIGWCHKGPSHAYIENIEITDDKIKGFRYFDVTF